MSYKGVHCILDICFGRRPLTWPETFEFWLSTVYRNLFNTHYELNITTTIVAALMVSLSIMIASYVLIKGRHRTLGTTSAATSSVVPTTSSTAQPTTSAAANPTTSTTAAATSTPSCSGDNAVHTNVYVSSAVPVGWSPLSQSVDSTVALKMQGEYNGSSDIKAWFMRLECCLEKDFKKKDWWAATISDINESDRSSSKRI